MQTRKEFFKNSILGGLGISLLSKIDWLQSKSNYTNNYIYCNWGAYDELSDTISLTQELAMEQLQKMITLRRYVPELNYYILDMFWFDKDGEYKQFRAKDWSDSQVWFDACKASNVIPGMWFSINKLGFTLSNKWLEAISEKWKSSLSRDGLTLCLFDGGYLEDLIKSMDIWYQKGIRLFKFDFADFKAATPDAEATFSLDQIIEMNENALLLAFKKFKNTHKDTIFLGYNGFGGTQSGTYSHYPASVKLKWLKVFDALYCGDPRPGDVPTHNFFRSVDIYSDYMVRQYQQNGVPLRNIDNSGFMIGNTGTCYFRGKKGWKAELILAYSRGSGFQTFYGDLGLLTESDMLFWGEIHKIFYPISLFGKTYTFGGNPGKEEPYGYVTIGSNSAVISLSNPSQITKSIDLPQNVYANHTKILFHDSGFTPTIENNSIKIGGEQVILLVTGDLAKSDHKITIDGDNKIAENTKPIKSKMLTSSNKSISYETILDNKCDKVRIVFKAATPGTLNPFRFSSKETMEKVLQIFVKQLNKTILSEYNYNYSIWAGLSWAVVEFETKKVEGNVPILIQIDFPEKEIIPMVEIYEVNYQK